MPDVPRSMTDRQQVEMLRRGIREAIGLLLPLEGIKAADQARDCLAGTVWASDEGDKPPAWYIPPGTLRD